MPNIKPDISSAGSADDVEASFYEAMQHADIDKLMACWADEDDIVCVHPGGGRLTGASAIRMSFELLFAHGSVRAQPEHVQRVQTMGSSVHSLVERIDLHTPQGPAQALVTTTNVYHRGVQGWRMVAHHASPGIPADASERPSSGTVLH
jgi:ketosteroid isomerase-like protein